MCAESADVVFVALPVDDGGGVGSLVTALEAR